MSATPKPVRKIMKELQKNRRDFEKDQSLYTKEMNRQHNKENSWMIREGQKTEAKSRLYSKQGNQAMLAMLAGFEKGSSKRKPRTHVR